MRQTSLLEIRLHILIRIQGDGAGRRGRQVTRPGGAILARPIRERTPADWRRRQRHACPRGEDVATNISPGKGEVGTAADAGGTAGDGTAGAADCNR